MNFHFATMSFLFIITIIQFLSFFFLAFLFFFFVLLPRSLLTFLSCFFVNGCYCSNYYNYCHYIEKLLQNNRLEHGNNSVDIFFIPIFSSAFSLLDTHILQIVFFGYFCLTLLRIFLVVKKECVFLC